ncbi:MAG: hypothetical protein NTV32_03595 [Gammaproteobacteria bacterium]|nr:hypothetical protein [Gammaproteobacteria bacterium]
MSDRNAIITAITQHIGKEGGGLSVWYVGIASNPKKRLFSDHNVCEVNGKWIHHEAASHTVARAAEQYFIDRGSKGGPGGGDEQTKYVYAYKVTAETRE